MRKIFFHSLKKKRYFGKRESCIFGCETPTFRNKSHALPKLFNSNIINLDECDECNRIFGDSIDSLIGEYVRPWLPLTSYGATYKDSGIRIENTIEKGQIININPNDIRIDHIRKMLIFPIHRPEISSTELLRAFAKYAVSLMPRSEMENLKETIKWIKDPKKNTLNLENHTIISGRSYGRKNLSYALLFQLEDPKTLILFIVANGIFLQSTVPTKEVLRLPILKPIFTTLQNTKKLDVNTSASNFAIVKVPSVIPKSTNFLMLQPLDPEIIKKIFNVDNGD